MEEMLARKTSRRMLSKVRVASHVSIGRHYKAHVRYPPKWPIELKIAVLDFARVRGAGHIDVFQSRDWEAWKDYEQLVKTAQRDGYDHGYVVTLEVMRWVFNTKELSRKIELFKHHTKNPFLATLGWWREQTASRGHNRLRYRLKIGYDGRSYIRRYKS